MNIISSTLPPVNSQPRFNSESGRNTASADERTEGVREIFAELVDENNLSVPVTAVLEPQQVEPQLAGQQRFLSETVNTSRLADTEELPLNTQQALASYQSVLGNSFAADASIARLDIIV